MPRSSSGIIGGCAASRWSLPGGESALLFARPRMRPGDSEFARPWRRRMPSACALRPSSFLPISRDTVPFPEQTREIFKRHTDLIEPLSLDEAYLDVTENKTGLATVNPRGARHPRTNLGGAESDRIGRRRSQQVPGENCLGLAQAQRAIRDSA